MARTRKRLGREDGGSILKNYADVIVLHMRCWMPYLRFQNNPVQPSSPPDFTWDSVKWLHLLCKSMKGEWEMYFYVQMHVSMRWIHCFRRAVPSDSLTFLRSDDENHRLLTYSHLVGYYYGYDLAAEYAVATLPWKSFLILQQSHRFKKRLQMCSRDEWRHHEMGWIGLPKLRPLVFQNVFHPMGPLDSFAKPRGEFHQWDEVNGCILGTVPKRTADSKGLSLGMSL